MAGESCNLDKDEAEILKPSSSSPPPPPPSPPTSPPSIFLKPQQPSLLLHHDAPGSNSTQIPESKVAATCFCHKRKREEREQEEKEKEKEVEENSLAVRLINRCSSCRKRVGLAGGFRCRCGDLFCARHRYSDTHHCSFDYKAAGREEIAKANPVIRAAKIIRI